MLLSPSFGNVVARWGGLCLTLHRQNLPPRSVLPTKIDLHSHFPPPKKIEDFLHRRARANTQPYSPFPLWEQRALRPGHLIRHN